jgi:hypothetical protein
MELGMIGLGRMGANMVRRLLRSGHRCVVYDLHAEAVAALVEEGAVGATSIEDFVAKLNPPRALWMMLPAGVVDPTLNAIVPLLARDDAVIDGGNSCYHDDAQWVLRDQPEWTPERIEATMKGARPTRVNLSEPLDVVLFYVTAHVGSDGILRFAEDIYGYDQTLDAALRQGYPYPRQKRDGVLPADPAPVSPVPR